MRSPARWRYLGESVQNPKLPRSSASISASVASYASRWMFDSSLNYSRAVIPFSFSPSLCERPLVS